MRQIYKLCYVQLAASYCLAWQVPQWSFFTVTLLVVLLSRGASPSSSYCWVSEPAKSVCSLSYRPDYSYQPKPHTFLKNKHQTKMVNFGSLYLQPWLLIIFSNFWKNVKRIIRGRGGKSKILWYCPFMNFEAKQLPSLKKLLWFRAKAGHTRHGFLI